MLKVLELFAGVGGFRLGLENADKDFFKTLWANQWDPGKKSQEAFEVYDYHFPDNWTEYKRNSDGMIEKVKDRMRMFFMGNALVTDIVKEIGYFIRKVELEVEK